LDDENFYLGLNDFIRTPQSSFHSDYSQKNDSTNFDQQMEDENFYLTSDDFLKTPNSTFQSGFTQSSNQFEFTPSDYQNLSSSDHTIYSSSDNRSYNNELVASFHPNNEYTLQEHYSWTTSTDRDSNRNQFFPSYQLSTDTPLSTPDHLRYYPDSTESIYHTANTHFSSSNISTMSLSEFPRDPISASTSFYNDQ